MRFGVSGCAIEWELTRLTDIRGGIINGIECGRGIGHRPLSMRTWVELFAGDGTVAKEARSSLSSFLVKVCAMRVCMLAFPLCVLATNDVDSNFQVTRQ